MQKFEIFYVLVISIKFLENSEKIADITKIIFHNVVGPFGNLSQSKGEVDQHFYRKTKIFLATSFKVGKAENAYICLIVSKFRQNILNHYSCGLLKQFSKFSWA